MVQRGDAAQSRERRERLREDRIRIRCFRRRMAEFDRALERYHRMLDECAVPAEAQKNIFAGTMWRILNAK